MASKFFVHFFIFHLPKANLFRENIGKAFENGVGIRFTGLSSPLERTMYYQGLSDGDIPFSLVFGSALANHPYSLPNIFIFIFCYLKSGRSTETEFTHDIRSGELQFRTCLNASSLIV